MWALSILMNGDFDSLGKSDLSQIFANLMEAAEIYHKSDSLMNTIRSNIFFLHSLYIGLFLHLIVEKVKKFDHNHLTHIWNQADNLKEGNPNFEFPLFLVLLWEQHAILFLKKPTPNFRKYCLHLIFAGYKFGVQVHFSIFFNKIKGISVSCP